MMSSRVAGRIDFHLTSGAASGSPHPISGLGIEPPIPLAAMPLDASIR